MPRNKADSADFISSIDRLKKEAQMLNKAQSASLKKMQDKSDALATELFLTKRKLDCAKGTIKKINSKGNSFRSISFTERLKFLIRGKGYWNGHDEFNT